jgi:hypothetical protein
MMARQRLYLGARPRRAAAAIGVVALVVAGLVATPASASTVTTLTAGTTLTGNQTLSSTALTATGAGVTATTDLVTAVSWNQPASMSTTFDTNLVRQGRMLNPSDAYTFTPGTGTLTLTWTLANTKVSWDGVGPLSLGSPSFSATGACDLKAGGPNYHCVLSSSQVPLIDTFPLPGPYVKLGLSVDVTITPQGLATLRQATFAGTPDGMAGLVLGPAPITDTFAIPCTVGAGDELLYSLGPISAAPGISETTNLVFNVGAEITVPDPFNPPFFVDEVDIPFAQPTIPIDTEASTVPMSGPGASFDMGAVQHNNIPPTADAGGPYAGNEGAPITFDGSASSSICGFPTLVWNFSDGGVAYGKTPSHTFEAPGTYSGLLTATDATGLTNQATFSVTVANLPPVADAGPAMSTEWGVPVTLNGSALDPGTAEQPLLTYAWDFGDGSPSASGGASVAHTDALPGTYTATLTVCDPENACGTSTTQVVVSQRATVSSYTGPSASDVTDPATLRASLIDDQWAPVVGRAVGFFEDGGAVPIATAMTDGSGVASVTHEFPAGQVGGHAIAAKFAGDALYTASQSSSAYAVSKDATLTAYTGATSAKPSHPVAASAVLTDDAGRPLGGQTVTFTLGAQGCTAVTDASGVGACAIAKLDQKSGSYTMVASFAGSPDYLPSSDSMGFTIG